MYWLGDGVLKLSDGTKVQPEGKIPEGKLDKDRLKQLKKQGFIGDAVKKPSKADDESRAVASLKEKVSSQKEEIDSLTQSVKEFEKANEDYEKANQKLATENEKLKEKLAKRG